MDWQRSLLISAMLVVVYMLFLEWNTFQEAHAPVVDSATVEKTIIPELPEATAVSAVTDIGDLPEIIDESSSPVPEVTNAVNTRLVKVSTDVLTVLIDTQGGDIVRVDLPKHLTELGEGSTPFILLNRTSSTTYIAQSGLVGANGTDTKAGRPLFSVDADQYQLQDGQDSLTVNLTLRQGEVLITKRFTFKRADYLVELAYHVDNQSSNPWKASLFGQIKRDSHNPTVGNSMGMAPFLGAALTSNDENYKKLDFEDIEDETFKETVTGGWVAMVQHYFISAWVPDQSISNTFNLRKLGSQDLYMLGFTSPQVTVEPGENGELKAAFYAGPKDQYRLEKISPYLDLTVDYGLLWWIAKPLFWVLYQLHMVLGNWGWSIIFLTVMIKAAFFRLSATSYRSMANMRKLQPEMARLKDLYGDDRQKMSQETMSLYKKEKVNPMGGCLPILVQMPVFMALYWVLLESVELRHSPWILWISDLSVKDPFFVLPLIMGVSMFVQQRLNPTPPDPMQAKVMQIMPIAFTFFFMFFPAGLVLYWTVNNGLSIIQQWLITRKIEGAGVKK
ncbi:MAG: membrane protein insertase YidC [Porticoccus sp.]|nr:membrane protein insertase YidC [Porticoccus sp.]